jgi:23S rRNA pseudouridine1911/1915/1917 synthase
MEIDCNIDEVEGKRMAATGLKATSEAPTTFKLLVPKEHARMRLDLFLVKSLPEFSRARIQQLIRAGFVRVGGGTTRPHHCVRSGDEVEVTEPPVEKIQTEPEAIPLSILYEDDDLIVINKASGMTVHPGAGQGEHTLVNALLYHCSTWSGIGGKERPGIVHRLDKETSGCIVAAKNDVAHRELSKQFTARTVEKIYLALVAGKLRKETGVIENKIGRHPVHRRKMSVSSPRGRAAKTEYRVLRSSEQASLIECTLHSGRTHQIRVHLHHIGNPVLGDKIYAPRFAKDFSRQMLHAWKLGFHHPRTGEWKSFEAPLPDDFTCAIAAMGLTTRLQTTDHQTNESG